MNKSLKIGTALRTGVTLILCLVLSCGFVYSQGKFYASAPKSIPENQNFNLTYTLENANGSNLRLPSLNDFTLLGGPNTSTSIQSINGSYSQSTSYTYVLRPKQQGSFKIGKATVVVNGNTIESNELTIEVTATSSKSQAQQPYGQQQEESTSDDDLAKQLKDDVFVKVILSRSSVYKGEMLSATYKLYFRQNLNGFNLTKAPALDGFWSKEVELDPNRKQKAENYNGKQYYTIEILKYNLYPQRSGQLQISPAEISTVARVVVKSKSRDPFNDPFFSDPFGGFFNMGETRNVPLELKTDPATVAVKELPENDKPKDFEGAVGKFSFETSLSAKESKTDDPVTYTIKISGNGNLNLIDAPTVQLPTGFEVYDPKVKEKITNSEGGTSGSKQYDYLIIPRLPGEYKIGGQVFSYFDPSSAKYVTITAPEFPLKITGEPSKNINANASTYVSKQGVSMLGEDIRYIKTSVPIFDKGNESFLGSTGFVALYSFPFLAFIGLIAVRRRNETLAADVIGSKRRKALKLAKKRLHLAEKNLAQGDKKKFYDEVSRSIWGYLGDKLNIDMAELSKDTVAEKLFARNVKPETIARLQGVLNSCDLSLYAPSGDAEMKVDYTAALNLIADLEDEIRS